MVFTLQSIKSRIETTIRIKGCEKDLFVFTLQSIKSRIETCQGNCCVPWWIAFLLYSPLNQGLKHHDTTVFTPAAYVFLLYSPLNQGLKLILWFAYIYFSLPFLLYSPLNQGLKPSNNYDSLIESLSFYSTVH